MIRLFVMVLSLYTLYSVYCNNNVKTAVNAMISCSCLHAHMCSTVHIWTFVDTWALFLSIRSSYFSISAVPYHKSCFISTFSIWKLSSSSHFSLAAYFLGKHSKSISRILFFLAFFCPPPPFLLLQNLVLWGMAPRTELLSANRHLYPPLLFATPVHSAFQCKQPRST